MRYKMVRLKLATYKALKHVQYQLQLSHSRDFTLDEVVSQLIREWRARRRYALA